MFSFIADHLAVILICAALVVLVAGAVAVLVRDKKKGKSSCGNCCGSCCNNCHNVRGESREPEPPKKS